MRWSDEYHHSTDQGGSEMLKELIRDKRYKKGLKEKVIRDLKCDFES